MKKTLLVILSLVLALSCFGLVACSKTDPQATLDMYIFEKDGQTISEDFVLPGTIGEFKATWSSNSDLITLTEVEADKENGIERQYVAKVGLPTERTAVDLTVLFKSKRISKTFTVYVNPLSVYDFSGSYNFVNNNGTVVEDFALDTSCEFKGHTATIAWSVDEEYANYLEISEDGKTCYVYPSSLNPQVKINATFTYNGVSTTKSYRMTVSEQKEPLQEVDYWYTNTGVGIVMSGYVVTIGTVYSDEYKNVTLYMVNDDFTAGYYLYRVKTDDANAALLQPGVHITVTETINTDYNGLMETNAGGNLVVDTDVAPINVSEKVYAVDNDIIGNLQSAYYNQSRLVSLTNWTVKEIKGTPDLSSGTQTLFVLTKGGVDVPVVISKYYEGAYAYKTSDATCSALIGLQSSLQVGDVVSVTGILGNYKGHQIAPLSASAVVKGGTADPEGTVYAGKTAAKAVATIDAIIAENGLDAAVVAVAKNVNLPAELEGCEVSYRIIGTPRSFAIDQGNLVINPGNMERACLTATITVDGFSTTIFRYITAADLDDAGKVEMEADALELDFTEIKENGSVSLPKASLFEGITISWESNNACAVVNGNSLRVVLPAEATTITLTATLTLGDAVLTKNFDVAVSAAPTTLYIPKLVSAPVEGQAYKFGFNQVKLGKTLYLTGVVSGRYLATTENTAEAVDVYVEAVEGGFKFYILDGETKLYLDVYLNGDGKDSLRFDANGENVFAYNAEVNAWATTHEGVAYYCGTYNDFDTMSASKLSYINASNTGVSQFPANFTTLVTAAYDTVAVSAPVEGQAYKFGFNQVKLGKTLYLTGVVSGRYLATTENFAEAVDVYVEVVEGGFKFYILDGETKLYLDVYLNGDGKDSLRFDANGENVFAYNAEVNAWATTHEGVAYYCGTYNDFDTMSASKLSYINASNTGVSQFPANFYVQELKEIAPKHHSAPVEGQAYKFGFIQVKLGKTLYLTGVVSGRYLATTENFAEAVDVYVEVVEGGFKFYILDGETKLYLDVYLNGDGKDSLRFDANGENVFAYNAEVNAWATTHEGVAYYCGTYNDFDTMSASKLSYINASNTGVSQFPANLITMDFVEESAPACEHANTTTTTVDSTCLVKGSVTVTCDDCGETVSTEELPLADHTMAPATCLLPSTCTEDGCGHTEGEALGHNYVEGVCQNGCGIAQEHVHSWSDATCTAPKSCACGATEGEALGHTMADATCEDPSTCSVCGHTEGAALGHKYGAWVPGESDTHVRVCENDESHKETIATGDLLADIFAIADKSNNTTTYPNQVTLVGVVDNISYAYTPNATSITVDIKILNHSDYVVKCYKLAGAGIDTVAVGDTITATGTIKNYYATIEFDGCTLLDNEKHTCVASSTWGSDNDNHWHVCSICNAKLETAEHDFINGTCECGKQAGVQETTITVSIANYASANGWANSTQYTTMTMDNNISVTVNGGGNSGKYYTSGTNWRLYQSESAELTISAANGKTIKSVKITYVVNNSGCLTHNGSNITSGTVVTVNATTTTFGVGNTGTATNGQARVTAIEVVYY